MKSNRRDVMRYLVGAILSLFGMMTGAVAAVTNLANGPLASGLTSASTAKPNIAFVVDDSGSMDYESMPADDGGYSNTSIRNSRCFGWYKFNTVFYNPAYTYKPPFKLGGTVYSDGVTRFPDASFTAALDDGYFPNGGYTFGGGSSSNSTTNLSTLSNLTPSSVSCTTSGTGRECSSSPSKYYYSKHKTNPDSTTCEASSNYSIVTDPNAIEAPGVPNTNRTSADIAKAKTNYANWYSYYRKRAYMMKAAAGEAFKDLDESKYRIGLFFINSVESGSNGSSDHPNHDFAIADYSGSASGTQRYDWYTKLYGSRMDGNTPLRGALSRMGRMYGGKISGWDPVQYSCQQNFTILSTDGFWNTGYETSSYGPKQLDNATNVGDVDGGPHAATSASATITFTGSTSFGQNRCLRATSISVPVSGNTVELLASTAPASCDTKPDNFGPHIRDSINNRTAITGFSATYSSSRNRLTITAPASLGNFTAALSPTFVRVSGSGSESVTVSNFGGGVDASTNGAAPPYKDAFNASNTLADITYYYYNTDLRVSGESPDVCTNTIGGTPFSDLCKNNVRGSGKDINSQQHMTTFTIGLGVSGDITYQSNYETGTHINGLTTYYDILNGTADWPDPTSSDTAKIDDLWHAAVNGHGTYYSAGDAQTLQNGIKNALAGIDIRPGSSSAAATSNLEPVAGDNYVYVALYQTVKWDGDLKAYSIDPDTGALTGSSLWSAQTQLDSQVAAATAAGTGDGRTIKFFSPGVTSKLKDFTLSNLTADSLDSYFTNICNKTPAIDQCGTDDDDLSAQQKTNANSGTNLVNYLRGSAAYEDKVSNATTDNRVYRSRDHALGDIVNAVPVYMKKPPFDFDKFDTTYGTFKSNNANRAPTVFVAANDGMLHAINADNTSNDKGKERWAYVPKQVMPNMWHLADRNYSNDHRYFVDGSPTVADICTSLDQTNNQLCADDAHWKTILVGGLNKGGCGYYALDVTDPTNPKGLWEFTNANLGYSYGNPVVAKRKNGQWVVFVASGYNNYPGNGCGNTGDGNGHVFVLDAATGTLLDDIATYTVLPALPANAGTTAGSTDTPSGLARLNAWIADASLPVADRLYAGDLLGNVWRIDFDDNYAPSGKEAIRLAQLKDGTTDHNLQPITTKPELAEIRSGGVTYPLVFVGTGRYLGSTDPNDVSQQSLYGLKDSLGASGISNVRGASMVQRTLTQTTGSANGSLAGIDIRTVSGATVNWASNDGWYLDFNPGGNSPGERVNVDMSLQLNTLTVAANVPSENACDVGGYAWLYFLDINTGKNILTSTDSMAGYRLPGNALVAGIKTIRLTSGKTVTIVTDTSGNVTSQNNPGSSDASGVPARRSSWREISD